MIYYVRSFTPLHKLKRQSLQIYIKSLFCTHIRLLVEVYDLLYYSPAFPPEANRSAFDQLLLRACYQESSLQNMLAREKR